MQGERVLDVGGIERVCPGEVLRAPRGPVAAYYWSNVNVLNREAIEARVPRIGLPGASCTRVDVSSPRTYVIQKSLHPRRRDSTPDAGGTTPAGAARVIVTIRGTRSWKDVHTDFSARLPIRAIRSAMEKELLKVYGSSPTPHHAVRSAVEQRLNGLLDDLGSVRVHSGFLARAVRCFVSVVAELHRSGVLVPTSDAASGHPSALSPTLALTPGSTVHLYGHSLGAACAAFLNAWLRDLCDAESQSRITSALLSCPRMVDVAGYDAWFRRHDRADAFRHYFTRSDVVVDALPSLAGLTHHPSLTCYVGTLPPLKRRALRWAPVLAHFVFDTSSFQKEISRDAAAGVGAGLQHGTRSAGTVSRRPSSARGRSLILVSPRFAGALRDQRDE
jgi:hypothetical protein